MKNSKKSNFSDFFTKDINSLRDFVTCKLCRGIFKEPFSISECTHSFCKSCIVLYISKSKDPKCPCCSLSLGPNPFDYIKSDSALEKLVEIVFPEFTELDEKEKVKFHLKKDTFLQNLQRIQSASSR